MRFWQNYAALLKSQTRGGTKAVLRRFTWEGLQALVGGAAGTYALLAMHVESVEEFDGVAVIKCWRSRPCWGGICFGSVILGDERIQAKVNNPLFMHEFGHTLQSRTTGPIYLFKYGFPSVLSVRGTGKHSQHPVEQDANLRAFEYFKTQPGFSPWPAANNPLPKSGVTMGIHWWEFLPPLFPVAHLYVAIRDRNGVE
jgi:hypothetical protein